MILYSKLGEFIGMGREELTMLGFDDMDDFLSYHKDFADLFVNKPGYIFKFKNFSWIDYALHSGAPKKSSILHLKNGSEIEVNLRIKEIYLKNPTENQEIYYCVEVSNHAFEQMPTGVTVPKNNTPIKTEEETLQETTPIDSQEPLVPQEEENEISFEQDYTPLEEDENTQTENEPTEFESSIKTKNQEENDLGVKLKVDDDVFMSSNKEEINLVETEPFIAEYEPETEIEIDSEEKSSIQEPIEADFSHEEIASEPKIEIKEENNFMPQTKIPQLNFDLGDCAENLDLDIGLIAEIITDYVEKLETNIPELYSYLQNNQNKEFKDTIYKLKGIADSLNIEDFSSQFNKILASEEEKEQKEQLQILEELFSQFKEKLV